MLVVGNNSITLSAENGVCYSDTIKRKVIRTHDMQRDVHIRRNVFRRRYCVTP